MIWEDDDEFLAAPIYGQPDVSGESGDDPETDEGAGPGASEEAWNPLQGFPDGLRAVRVWPGDEGAPGRVRVSLNWREKLRDSSLDHAFFTAFAAMNAVCHTGEHPLPRPAPLPAKAFGDAISWQTLEIVRRERCRIDARMAELADAMPTRWVGEPAVGSAFGKGVVVTLGLFGHPVSARFDPEWIEGPVRSSELSRGVMTAWRQALKKFRPPRVEFGERELLAREYDRLDRSLLLSFQNGLSL
mgnify:CR=1 FL=1